MIGGDGIMPADAGSQMHCEVIEHAEDEKAEQWGPDAAVVG